MMKVRSISVAALALLLGLGGTSSLAGSDGKKGHGAGGVSADKMSETGAEKGKRYAGSKAEEQEKKARKIKKDKKDKKARKAEKAGDRGQAET